MPHRNGAVTASTAEAETAASAALPPSRSTATPACEARWSTLATIAVPAYLVPRRTDQSVGGRRRACETGMVLLRAAWDRHADQWVDWARRPGHDSYWRFHRDAFWPLVPAAGRLTVDIGCGEGRVSRDLAAAGHQVVGVDASPRMAAAAASFPAATPPVVVGDAAALPLPDAVADCAIAFMCLQDVDDLERAMAECRRVLLPGGRLALAVTHPANTSGRFEGDDEETTAPFVIRGSWFERRRTADTCERDGLVMEFHSEHRPLEDYAEALAANEFVIVRLREVGDPDPSSKWHRVPLFVHILAERR